ncbi:MAG: cyclic nucleotide-binding domain-containing protein, partial [Elusimicrobiales bacterium]|nr:cyclic nucleotide-binding domain-containing protein [Elusimicrobiales bacterium]
MTLHKALEQVTFLKGLGRPDLNHIVKIAAVRRYKAGDMVFNKEEVGKNFFILNAGKIKIFTSLGGGKKKTFAFLGKGDFFGEMSLLGGKIRSASAQALEDTELLVISKQNFGKLVARHADFSMKIIR